MADILIGGTTDHDANLAALLDIMAEWKTGISYDLRTIHLRDGSGLNGFTRLHSGVVHNDNSVDMLTGGLDSDWFFANSNDPNDLSAPPERNT